MNSYKILNKQVFTSGNYSIVPIRMEDRFSIMKWRNEQMYHLRQKDYLTTEGQNKYFNTTIATLFDQEQPEQILFSYLEGNKCIGYGGLVHINWIDRNAEISFIMDTNLEKQFFKSHWQAFLGLIEKVAFNELSLYKIFTFAFDLRPKLYKALEKMGFKKECVLKNHSCFESLYYDVVIHSKFFDSLSIREAKFFDTELTFKWATNSIIRKYAFNKKPIEWENHKQWYSNKIIDSNCEYYILSDNGHSIGSIRFDIDKDCKAVISYLINPIFHGKGYGEIILEKGIEKLKEKRKDIKRVLGSVQKDNIASIKIFKKMGFKNTSVDLELFRFEKKQ